MIRSRLGRIVRVTIPLILVVVVTSVVTLSAQGNPTLHQIMAQLATIIEMLTPPPPPPASELTLATSALFVSAAQEVRCILVNLGTEPLDVTARFLDQTGEVKLEGSGTVPPTGLAYLPEAGSGNFRRCEFTFIGTAASVRINMIVSNLADGAVTASVEAR